MAGKQPGKNYRRIVSCPLWSPGATGRDSKSGDLSESWPRGSLGMPFAWSWQSNVTLGSSDDEGFAGCVPGYDLGALRPGESRGDVAHQGSHQYRRRAAEP